MDTSELRNRFYFMDFERYLQQQGTGTNYLFNGTQLEREIQIHMQKKIFCKTKEKK